VAIEFVHETGTGSATSTSYAFDTEADQYMENTGRKDEWKSFSSNERKAALNAATLYMDDTYGDRYCGVLPESTKDIQALLWPREEVPNNRGGFYPGLGSEIPDVVHEACTEFALAYLQNGNQSLYPATVQDGRTVKRALVRVEGAVTKETEYDGGITQPAKRSYPLANAKIRQVITPVSRYLLRA
jgi:hypothetical protein